MKIFFSFLRDSLLSTVMTGFVQFLFIFSASYNFVLSFFFSLKHSDVIFNVFYKTCSFSVSFLTFLPSLTFLISLSIIFSFSVKTSCYSLTISFSSFAQILISSYLPQHSSFYYESWSLSSLLASLSMRSKFFSILNWFFSSLSSFLRVLSLLEVSC